MSILDWFNPARWIMLACLVAALVIGVPLIVHRYNDGLREEGRAEVRKADKEAAEAQTTSNRELGRMAELHLSVTRTQQDEFFVRSTKEIHDASAPLAACPVPELVRLRLNAAAECASGDSAASCGSDAALPHAR